MTLSLKDIDTALHECSFPGYSFSVHGGTAGKALYLQADFNAKCAQTGKVERQFTRKWQLSPHMTRSEIVQTAFKCVLTSVEHEAREQFKYRGQAIFGPHFDVEKLVDLCQAEPLDARS